MRIPPPPPLPPPRFSNIVAHRTLYESVGMGSYRIYGSLSKADI